MGNFQKILKYIRYDSTYAMRYYYRCNNEKQCKLSDIEETRFEAGSDCENVVLKEQCTITDDNGDINFDETPVIIEVIHSMTDDPIINCPVCKHPCQKLISLDSTFYFRGNGYLDKAGCKRDMNLHKLMTDDPYASMRQSGEKEYLMDKCRKAGKFNPKTKYYLPKS